MTDPRTDDVDGVATFWVDSGRPTLAASLLFRGGRADEPLHESGWLHLLEHLALEDRASGTLHVNGSVSALTTSFDLHGPTEAVSAVLASLTAWLDDPDLARVSHESKVLAAESAWRGSNPLSRSFSWRFGATGPGVISYDELGLTRATPERLAARAREVFTTGNAVLVLDGPPPADLRLTLPSGPSVPPRSPRIVETGPGAYGDRTIIATGLVPREHASTFAVEVLRAELEKSMRHSAGHVYTVLGHYEHVSADAAILGVSAETKDKHLSEVVTGLHRLLAELASHGPRQTSLDDLYAQREQALHDPAAAAGAAYRAGHRHLEGKMPETREDLLRGMRAVTPADVRAVLEQVTTSLLLGTPDPEHAPVPVLPDLRITQTETTRTGRRWRSVNAPVDPSQAVLDGTELTLHGGDKRLSRSLDDVAAYLVMPDGYRSVIGSDGFAINLDPTAWRAGHGLVEAVDAGVPGELHLPRALDEKPTPFARVSAWKRGLGAFGNALAAMSGAAFAVVLALVAIVVIVGVRIALRAAGQEDFDEGPLPLLLVAFCAGAWREQRKLRRARPKAPVS